MVDALSDKGACKTPMSDHVSRFYNLLRDEYVHIRVDIRRTMGDGTTYFDGSSFSNDVAKAISDAVAEREAEPVGRSGDAQDIANRLRCFFNQPGDARRLALDAAVMIEYLNKPSPPTPELEAENARLREALVAANARAEDQWAGWVKEEVARKSAEARLAEAMKALEKSENLFAAISHHIDEHSFSLAKGFCSQGAFIARRVREGGNVE